MTYVPVYLWVPDDAEAGAVTSQVNLKLCDECHAPIPNEFMDDHMARIHPPPPVATPT